VAAATSGALTYPQQATLQTTVIGPGTLTFWWMASGFAGTRYFSFSINGRNQATLSPTGWQQTTYYLGSGTNILLWTFYKSDTFCCATFAGYVDQVSFTPGGTAPAITSMSPNAYVRANSSAAFSVSAYGTPPLTYQWQFNSVTLYNKTNVLLSLANVQLTNAGIYTVVITNNVGVVTTNATLWVGQFAFNPNPTNTFMSPNGMQLELDGILTSNPVVVWDSTDLVNWLPLFTNSATTGSVQFIDVTATNIPARFYRAQE
jgi:hypothetical protein